MARRLLRYAELEGDAFSDGCGNLNYIPIDFGEKVSGQTSVFLGFQACYVAAAHYLRKGKAPTEERIRGSASPPIRCIRGYLAQGGKIEYVLDAIIALASKCEEDDLEYDSFYQALPKSRWITSSKLTSWKKRGGRTCHAIKTSCLMKILMAIVFLGTAIIVALAVLLTRTTRTATRKKLVDRKILKGNTYILLNDQFQYHWCISSRCNTYS